MRGVVIRRHLLSFCKKYVAYTEHMFYNDPIENKLFALELRKRGSFYEA